MRAKVEKEPKKKIERKMNTENFVCLIPGVASASHTILLLSKAVCV